MGRTNCLFGDDQEHSNRTRDNCKFSVGLVFCFSLLSYEGSLPAN